MAINSDASPSQDEFPPRGDLREMMDQKPLPMLTPGLVDPATMAGDAPSEQAQLVLNTVNAALAADDNELLASCFFASQAYWKDHLALTYHLRTFESPSVISESLLETKTLRALKGEIMVDGAAIFLPATPVLQFIDCPLTFRTESPAATCKGKMLLLPTRAEPHDEGSAIQWKIWILSTRLASLDVQEEDETLLRLPARELNDLHNFETDVFIVGGGNAAIALSARLKALGVDSVMAEKNPCPGDNWALRYDCMKFHIPTSFCELPFMSYDEALQSPHLLTRNELAAQVRRYVETFNLNMVNSAEIQSTQYDPSQGNWEIRFQTPTGLYKAVSKQLVLATGIGSQKPNIPNIGDRDLYRGISLHSAQYKNAQELKEKDVKSVLIIGSANTAFDVLEDCHAAGLQSTMVVRSPTYCVPVDYCCHPMSLGAYDGGVELADNLFMTLPAHVDAQLARGLFAAFASKEPERYAALRAAGFPVLDSSDPTQSLMHNLLEQAGGHYVDVGGTKLIEEGKVGIKAGVSPVKFTTSGLCFSDGTAIDADAVILCTGFADSDVRETAFKILGGGDSIKKNGVNGEIHRVLDPRAIADRLEGTWGLDAEGEIRGMWKRHQKIDDFWVMGGYTQQHRWHSRTLALQIKAALAGILPPAYRDTPQPQAA